MCLCTPLAVFERKETHAAQWNDKEIAVSYRLCRVGTEGDQGVHAFKYLSV